MEEGKQQKGKIRIGNGKDDMYHPIALQQNKYIEVLSASVLCFLWIGVAQPSYTEKYDITCCYLGLLSLPIPHPHNGKMKGHGDLRCTENHTAVV